jgi:olefin beta-lactone synthetase
VTVNSWTLKGIMAIPLIGWGIVLLGIVQPFENKLLKIAWWIVASLVGGLHAVQLPIALPIGKRVGLSPSRIITKTMLYGASWWKPLQSGLIRR